MAVRFPSGLAALGRLAPDRGRVHCKVCMYYSIIWVGLQGRRLAASTTLIEGSER